MTTPADDREALLPCPFCGAGTTNVQENGRIWSGMKYSEPSSVSVRHWCVDTPGQPSRMIERVGRDEASAIEAWNRRSAERARILEPQSDAAGDLTAPPLDAVQRPVQQPSAYQWQGPGPEPASWFATDGTKVYRSYGDYVDD